MTTDISEKGLESIIVRHMTGTTGLAVAPNRVAERPPAYGGTGPPKPAKMIVAGPAMLVDAVQAARVRLGRHIERLRIRAR